MSKPKCFNRPAYKDTITAQDGWSEDGRRRMVERPNRMSKECQQHTAHGEATIWGWDCEGCVHLPGAKR